MFFPKGSESIVKNHRIKFSKNPHDPVKEYSVEEFEDISGMVYLPRLAYKSKKCYVKVKRLCEKAFKRGDVSERAIWFGRLYGHLIDEPFINDIYIAWTGEEMEYGCYSGKKIVEGAFIGEYTGLVRPCTFWNPDVNEYCFRYPLYKRFFVVYTIDGKMQGNETSFINHSSSPNCEAVAIWHKGLYHMCLIALENIPEDAQLLLDYGNKRFDT